MKFLLLILSPFFVCKNVVIVDKFLRVPDSTYTPYSSKGLFAPYSRELLFESVKYDYFKIEDVISSLNYEFLVNGDTAVTSEFKKLFKAYDNRKYDTNAYKTIYNDSLNYSERIESKHLYYKDDTLIIAYSATASMYILDSLMSKHINVGRQKEVVIQKNISLPLVFLWQTSRIKFLSKNTIKELEYFKDNKQYFYRSYYEW